MKFKTAMLNAKEKLGYEGTGNHTQRSVSIPAQIAELDELRKQGIVTEEEFKAKKKELLAKNGVANGLVIATSPFFLFCLIYSRK